MAYTNETGHYPVGHVFTDTELSNITPDEIIRYFKFKLYGDGDVDISDKPLTGSHHTLGKSLDCIASLLDVQSFNSSMLCYSHRTFS